MLNANRKWLLKKINESYKKPYKIENIYLKILKQNGQEVKETLNTVDQAFT